MTRGSWEGSLRSTDRDSYFVRADAGRFRPTLHTGGAWSAAEQHFSPLAGLLTHAIDRFVAARGNDNRVIGRITFDILGTTAIDEFDVRVEVVRPGRTIELLEAVADARGRPFVRARAWRLQREDTAEVAGGEPVPKGRASRARIFTTRTGPSVVPNRR